MDKLDIKSFDDGVNCFVKALQAASLVKGAGTNPGDVFDDFLECAYCAMAKVGWQQLATLGFAGLEPKMEALEARYMVVAKRSNKAYMTHLAEMLALVTATLEVELGDFFGVAAGRLEKLSSHLGQFFTPNVLCQLTARITLGDSWPEVIAKDGLLTLAEPTSGGGAMLAACAVVLQERLAKGDLPYQLHRHVYVQAVDVSPLAFKMTYILCSLCGLSAEVVHGDTLSLETFETAYTPLYFHLYTNPAFIRYKRGKPKKPKVVLGGPGLARFARLMRKHKDALQLRR
jgi:hypothetical protein